MAESKKQYTPEDFEPYFVGIMDMFAKIKDILQNDVVEPSISLFENYNRIVSLSSAELDASKAELAASLEKNRADFDSIRKKMIAIKIPESIPPALKIFIGTAREKSRENILDSLKASEVLLGFLEGRVPADLARAQQLLGKMVI
jgi:hypothetical protein